MHGGRLVWDLVFTSVQTTTGNEPNDIMREWIYEVTLYGHCSFWATDPMTLYLLPFLNFENLK